MKQNHVLILITTLILLLVTTSVLVYKNINKDNLPKPRCVHHEAIGDLPAEYICTTD